MQKSLKWCMIWDVNFEDQYIRYLFAVKPSYKVRELSMAQTEYILDCISGDILSYCLFFWSNKIFHVRLKNFRLLTMRENWHATSFILHGEVQKEDLGTVIYILNLWFLIDLFCYSLLTANCFKSFSRLFFFFVSNKQHINSHLEFFVRT